MIIWNDWYCLTIVQILVRSFNVKGSQCSKFCKSIVSTTCSSRTGSKLLITRSRQLFRSFIRYFIDSYSFVKDWCTHSSWLKWPLQSWTFQTLETGRHWSDYFLFTYWYFSKFASNLVHTQFIRILFSFEEFTDHTNTFILRCFGLNETRLTVH